MKGYNLSRIISNIWPEFWIMLCKCENRQIVFRGVSVKKFLYVLSFDVQCYLRISGMGEGILNIWGKRSLQCEFKGCQNKLHLGWCPLFNMVMHICINCFPNIHPHICLSYVESKRCGNRDGNNNILLMNNDLHMLRIDWLLFFWLG